MDTSHEITIEQVEALATKLESDDQAKRAKMLRLIHAYCRVIAQRSPGKFARQAVACRDEEGHFDNSYPPSVLYCEHTGPRLLQIRDNRTDDVATSGGFYYNWKRVTEDRGVWVGRDGALYGCEETGTGELGQFAAHPGDCNVDVTLEWEQLDLDDVDTEDLVETESKLRGLAFPASIAA
jgi:hypothetical protein